MLLVFQIPQEPCRTVLFLQAQKAFEIWTEILPELNEEFLEHLKND